MIIACPSCSARYVVDPVKIGPDGRTVKCAKCGHAWAQSPPPPEPEPEPAAPEPTEEELAASLRSRIGQTATEPDDASFDADPAEDVEEDFRASFDKAFSAGGASEPDRPRRGGANLPALPRKPSRWPARIAWLFLILVIGGTFGGAIAFQESITKTWPASKKLYETVGLTPEPARKQLGVRSVQYTYPSANVLRIDGELVNSSKVPHVVPNLRVLFLDAQGAVVKTWKFPPPERRMLPDEVVKFSTEIVDPPAAAKRIDVGVDDK